MSASRSAKSTLFEYCQKRKIGPPCFETWAAANGYQARVIIDGYPYPDSAVCSKKKDAEHDASNACLASLGVFDNRLSEYKQEWGIPGYPGDNCQPNFGTPSPHSNIATPSPHSDLLTPSPRSFGRPPQNSGSSGGNVKMPKSVLHEFCQSQKLPLPQYETEASYDGHVLLGFDCVLVVKDEYFTTDRLYTNKREAEHAVARKALNVFGYYARSPLITGNTPTQMPLGTPSFRTPETSYKNLLQEHLQQRNIETPQYETQLTEGGYFSKVTIEGKMFEAEECCQTKKMAEQSAAKAGLVGMGVKDPEAIATRLLGKNSKGRYKSQEDIPYKKDLHDLEPDQLEIEQVQGNTSWVHSRKQPEFDVDDYDDIDGEFTDFQKAAPVQVKRKDDETDGHFFSMPEQRPHKMQRVGEGSDNNKRPLLEKRPRRRGEFEVEDVHLGNLSVGEAWPEKRNIVIVGSEETSIPLFCQAGMDRCALEDVSKGKLVDIVPGHRLVGLEGYYVVRGGQIVLRAKQCQQVVMPEQPDKVLISCGIVVLHCIPRREGNVMRCDVNVLLKRYLCSQAFINVVRGLAQYFRCKQSRRIFNLNKDLIVAFIKDWMLEEVMAIASLSENALENVFQHTMKFDKRWGKYLREEELSKELKEIQAAANEELFRRANSGEDQNQDRFRPWRLPKGNFYHRILTTGVFIESPPEAAMRELKEETGIKLKLSDVTSSPYVDVPQTDNINPHKGDFARYYLCGIITEAEDHSEENEEYKLEGESSVGNPAGSSTDVAQLSTGPCPAITESAYAGTNSTGTGSIATITSSTYDATSSANAAGYLTSTGSAPGATDHGTTGSSGYTGTGDTNTGAYSAYGSTSTSYTDTNASHANTNSAYDGAHSSITDTRSTYGSAYSAYTDAYSGKANTHSTYPNTQPNAGNTNSMYGNTTLPYSGTSSDNPPPGSTHTGFGSNTGPSSGYGSSFSSNIPEDSNTDMASTCAGAFSANTGSTSSYIGTGSNTERDSNIKSEKEEESAVIRSPFVNGALHEECKWFDVEEAREISDVFNNIHNSPQFQKLIAKLKGIVSAM